MKKFDLIEMESFFAGSHEEHEAIKKILNEAKLPQEAAIKFVLDILFDEITETSCRLVLEAFECVDEGELERACAIRNELLSIRNRLFILKEKILFPEGEKESDENMI